LHDKLLELNKGFFGCFIKPESLKLVGDGSKQIRQLDVDKDSNHLHIYW
jgi:hypothetical protein